jgi:hypothetical protein
MATYKLFVMSVHGFAAEKKSRVWICGGGLLGLRECKMLSRLLCVEYASDLGELMYE